MRPIALLPKIALAAFASFAAVALLACGGDGESQDSPEDVTEQFLTAIAEKDAEGACQLVSSDALDAIEAQGQGDCEEVVTQLSGEVTEDDRKQVDEATYEVTEEDENSATVTATRPDGDEETFQLVNEDGEWKISQ